jgi:hypothetical protein
MPFCRALRRRTLLNCLCSPSNVPSVSLAVEGPTDAAVIARLLARCGLEVAAVYGQEGKARIDSSLSGYNQAAAFGPWVVVRDLDNDAACAADLAADLLPQPAQWMRFRIAVRSVESWLLADASTLAGFLRVKKARVPVKPDLITNPKLALVNLARQSTRPAIVYDMVPKKGVSSTVGPAYSARVIEFASKHWQIDAAMRNSDSLRRCVLRVQELAAFGSAPNEGH